MSELTMIKMKVQHERRIVEISFPCSDQELYDKMVELRLPQPSVAIAYVSEIVEPEELAWLQNDTLNLDEVNYLAKRMESFWGSEYWQFLEAARLEGFTQLKDLINLSFNLDKYTLIRDISDKGKVGREYVLNTKGAVPANEEDNPEYAEIGSELLQTGKGVFTNHGFLITDTSRAFEELYNGKNFPPYLYRECVVIGKIQYEENTEYVFLPDDDLVIDKAVARLGADNIHQCRIKLEDNTVNQNERKSLTELVDIQDIYEVNHFLNEVGQHLPSVCIPKLLLIVEYANVSDKANVVSLAKEIDAFDVIDGVADYEELAKQWIEREDDLEISLELQPYFDYESYGRELVEEQEGQFMEDGCYVYLRNGYCMDEILDIDKNEPIEMGGM